MTNIQGSLIIYTKSLIGQIWMFTRQEVKQLISGNKTVYVKKRIKKIKQFLLLE